jgi:hypothetical protein
MIDTLIWAGAVLALGMTALLWLLPPARRAIDAWGSAHAVSAAEREAKAQEALAGVEERRHRLAVGGQTIGEEVAREKARLEAEAAQFETDAEAARVCLEPAVAARQRALEARADAEAALAPEAARKALGGEDMAILAEAYATFCGQYGYASTPTFDAWIGNFRGLSDQRDR